MNLQKSRIPGLSSLSGLFGHFKPQQRDKQDELKKRLGSGLAFCSDF